MGRKYASIFIRADAMSEEALRSAWQKAMPLKPLAMPDPVSFMEKLGLGGDVDEKQAGVLRAMVSKFQEVAARGASIAERGKAFVLNDMRLGFETVENAALALSAQIEPPVLFAAVYDEDVYLFGVCKAGALLGKQADGDGLRAYGLQGQSISGEALAGFLGDEAAADCAGKHGQAMEAALNAALGHALAKP